METIFIDAKISMHQGVVGEEGVAVYNEILSLLKADKCIELNFQGVSMVTAVFLNVAIGQLYGNYTSEQLRSRIFFTNLSGEDALRVKKVVDNAKIFYKKGLSV